ncbi:uncharacterized protein LOC117304429 isoform X2 [Asterias rubens]|uniref:uncharacterized protein LOC117304429 isoform X2 n=1 Tax=Asterias rubens TaxID=7604 RepID=UPI0014555A4E|nr:uncharacterized protein LOC117304429 isoform X2 [Asterias rubens]
MAAQTTRRMSTTTEAVSTGLTEEDIPGAKQDVSVPALQKLKCHELKFWLQRRGDSCKGVKTKAQLIQRIQQTVSNGKHSTVIDPTPDKHWESLKAQRVPSGPICTIHSADPIPKKGSYHQWGSSTDWGKRLESLPDLTRREIDLHIDTVNMRIRPQKDSTRVSKPAIRGAHLLAERYLNSETISTRSGPICCFAQLQRIINVNLL